MKLFLDFLPIILFFIAYKTHGIYVATGVAIAASVLQIAYLLVRRQKVEPMQWAGLGIIAVFGGMTLAFQDETFIKWKPTVLYALFGLGLLVSRYALQKNGIKALMGKQLQLPESIWDRANLLWVVFFLLMSALNLYVAYRYSTETWVNFKLFGTMGLTFAFIVAQALYLGRFSAQAHDVFQAKSSSELPGQPSGEQNSKR